MEAVLQALQIRTMQTRTMPTPKKDQASGVTLTPLQLLANPAHWPSLAEAKIIKAPVVPSKAKPGRRPSATAEPATTTTDSESQSPPFVVADFTLAAVGTSNVSAANDQDNISDNDTTIESDIEISPASVEEALAHAAALAASEKASAQARSEAEVLAAMTASCESPLRLPSASALSAATSSQNEADEQGGEEDDEAIASRFAAQFAADAGPNETETPRRRGAVTAADLEAASDACDACDESGAVTAADLEAAADLCGDYESSSAGAAEEEEEEEEDDDDDEPSSADLSCAAATAADLDALATDTQEEATSNAQDIAAMDAQNSASEEVPIEATTGATSEAAEEVESPISCPVAAATFAEAKVLEAEARCARERAAELQIRLAESRAELFTKRQATAASVVGLRVAAVQLRGFAKASLDACAQDVGSLFGTLLQRTKQHGAQARDCEALLLKETLRRKKLFNELQAIKGNIRVFARVRPPSSAHAAAVESAAAAGASGVAGEEELDSSLALAVKVTKEGDLVVEEAATKSKAPPPPRAFEFDHVFGSGSNQAEVFREVAPLVTSVVDGYHASIIAYGQTGSGKTWTMEGSAEQPGVNARALEELFRLKGEREATGLETVTVQLTMVEVYNEQVKDLLRPASGKAEVTDQKSALCEIRLRAEGEGGGVHLPTATVVRVGCAAEVAAAMARGQATRSVGKTKANEHSSRSHSVLMVNVACGNKATGAATVGRLCLVDLAGSERIAKTGAAGDTLKEAQNINKSLSALGNVISALRAKQDSGKDGGKDGKSPSLHVPFRDSKLTYLLQDSLGADNKTLVVVQVSPEQRDAQETVCSLTFGQRARNVELGGGRGSNSSSGGKAGSGGGKGGASAAAAAAALAKAQQDTKEQAKRVGALAERLADESKHLKAAEKALQAAEVAKAKAVSGAEAEVASLKAQLEASKADAARAKQQAASHGSKGAKAAAEQQQAEAAAKQQASAAAAAAAAESELTAAADAAARAAAEAADAAAAAAASEARAESAAVAEKLRAEMDAMRADFEHQVAALTRAAQLPAATTPAKNTRAAQASALATSPAPPAVAPAPDDDAPLSPKLSFAAVAASPPVKQSAGSMVAEGDATSPVPAANSHKAGKTSKKSALANTKTPKKAAEDYEAHGSDENAGQRRSVTFKSPFKSPDAKPLAVSRQQQPLVAVLEDGSDAFGRAKGTAATPLKVKRALGPNAAAVNKPRDLAATAPAAVSGSAAGVGPSRVTVADAKPKAVLRNGPLRVTSAEAASGPQPMRRQSMSRWH